MNETNVLATMEQDRQERLTLRQQLQAKLKANDKTIAGASAAMRHAEEATRRLREAERQLGAEIRRWVTERDRLNGERLQSWEVGSLRTQLIESAPAKLREQIADLDRRIAEAEQAKRERELPLKSLLASVRNRWAMLRTTRSPEQKVSLEAEIARLTDLARPHEEALDELKEIIASLRSEEERLIEASIWA